APRLFSMASCWRWVDSGQATGYGLRARNYRAPTTGVQPSIQAPRALRSLEPALCALAMPPQIIPGVDPAGVPILPVELKRITPDSMRTGRLSRRRVHRQQIRSFGFRLPSLPSLSLALVNAR